MTMNQDALEHLLRSQSGIWRGRRAASRDGSVVATGFPELDAALPGGGWPLGALLEIGAPCLGIGELRLLLPAMASLSRGGRWIVWIAPPYRPYAPALLQAGVELGQILVVQPRSADDILWSLEKLLRSGCCGMTLAWLPRLAVHQGRRLQLAAEEGGAMAVLFSQRGESARYAALRIKASPDPEGLAVSILKARGSLSHTAVTVKLWDASPSFGNRFEGQALGAEESE